MPTDERPSSMGQALEAAGVGVEDAPDTAVSDSSADTASVPDGSSPSTDPDPSLAAPDARVPGSDPESVAAASAQTPGPIPEADHKRIVSGFHQKLDAATAELKALEWAKQVPAEIATDVVEILQRVQGDPVGFAVELVNRAQNDPKHAASIKSHAARLLASRGPAQAPAPSPRVIPDSARSGVPEVDAVLDARDRLIAEQLAEQFSTVLQERVGPLASLAQRVADAEAQQERTKTATEFAKREFAAVEKLPGFLQHREAIADAFAAEMAKYPEAEQDAHAPVVLRDVYHTIVLPTLTQTSADTVRQTLTAKAVAGSLGARPTQAAGVSRPRSMAEALNQAGVG